MNIIKFIRQLFAPAYRTDANYNGHIPPKPMPIPIIYRKTKPSREESWEILRCLQFLPTKQWRELKAQFIKEYGEMP